MKEDDFRQIASFIDEGVQLSIEAKKKTGTFSNKCPQIEARVFTPCLHLKTQHYLISNHMFICLSI